MSKVWIGIDPGLTGAIAVIGHTGNVLFIDTPTYIVQAGKKNRTEYDIPKIVHELRDSMPYMPTAVIERQQAMPAVLHGREQGTVSSFRTGYGYGMWIGVLTALGIPFEVVASVSWKSKLMKDMPKDKCASIIRATQLFPQAASQLTRKKDHARADALLIAEYARRIYSDK